MLICLVDIDGTLVDGNARLNQDLIKHLLQLQSQAQAQIFLFSSMDFKTEKKAIIENGLNRAQLIAELQAQGLKIEGLVYLGSAFFQGASPAEAFSTLFIYDENFKLKGMNLETGAILPNSAGAALKLSELLDRASSLFKLSLLGEQGEMFLEAIYSFYSHYQAHALDSQLDLLSDDLRTKFLAIPGALFTEIQTHFPEVRGAARLDMMSGPDKQALLGRHQVALDHLAELFKARAARISPNYAALVGSHDCLSELQRSDRGTEKAEMYFSLLDHFADRLTARDVVVLYDDKQGVIEALNATHTDLRAQHQLMSLQICSTRKASFCNPQTEYLALLQRMVMARAESLRLFAPKATNYIAQLVECLPAFEGHMKELIARLSALIAEQVHQAIALPVTPRRVDEARVVEFEGTNLVLERSLRLLTALASLLPLQALEHLRDTPGGELDLPSTGSYLKAWLDLASLIMESSDECKKTVLLVKLDAFYRLYVGFASELIMDRDQRAIHLKKQAQLLTIYGKLDEMIQAMAPVAVVAAARAPSPAMANIDKLLNHLICYMSLVFKTSKLSRELTQPGPAIALLGECMESVATELRSSAAAMSPESQRRSVDLFRAVHSRTPSPQEGSVAAQILAAFDAFHLAGPSF